MNGFGVDSGEARQTHQQLPEKFGDRLRPKGIGTTTDDIDDIDDIDPQENIGPGLS
jgi:hypothetical protein